MEERDEMGAVRIVVEDVEAAIGAFEAAGYAVSQRWGPPFAVMSGNGADLWISGPETSAARVTAELSADLAPCASVRPVHEVDELEPSVATLLANGWSHAAGPVSGPGGAQQLLRRGTVFIEVFAPGHSLP
jgi:hypothetical protein